MNVLAGRDGFVRRLLLVMSLAGSAALPMELHAQQFTTVIVVRHTEKVSEASDAVLSAEGWERAADLERLLKDAPVEALFASQYARAQQTLQPIVSSRGLEIQVHDAGDSAGLARRILEGHAGEVVVVSGHSNTVPEIVAALGATEPPPIEDWDYDDLFVVTVGPDGHAGVVHLRYGDPSLQPVP